MTAKTRTIDQDEAAEIITAAAEREGMRATRKGDRVLLGEVLARGRFRALGWVDLVTGEHGASGRAATVRAIASEIVGRVEYADRSHDAY